VARSEEEEDLLESAQAASDGESRDCLVAPTSGDPNFVPIRLNSSS
jgi:hypothetical protein